MAWIESHQALSRHKKTLALAAFLKTDRHKVLGHLHELWWWGVDNADTYGLLGVVPSAVVAEAAGWPLSKADAFVDGLVSAGFVDQTDDGLVLHDWYDYAGKLNVRRDENRERMRRKREQPQPPHDPHTNGTSAEHVQRTNAARAPATVPNPTVPNRTVPEITRDVPPVAKATSPRKQRRIAEVDDDFKAELVERFWEPFGSREAVEDCISAAMGYRGISKYVDQRAYLRNWVRSDAEKAEARRSNGRPRPGSIRAVGEDFPQFEQPAYQLRPRAG